MVKPRWFDVRFVLSCYRSTDILSTFPYPDPIPNDTITVPIIRFYPLLSSRSYKSNSVRGLANSRRRWKSHEARTGTVLTTFSPTHDPHPNQTRSSRAAALSIGYQDAH